MRRAGACLALCGALAAPAPAVADDLSVRTAACSNDAGFARLGERVARERAALARRHNRRPSPLLRALAGVRSLIADTRAAILGETPSSADGTRARRLYLTALRSLDMAVRIEAASARRAARSGRPDSRGLARAHRSTRRAISLERRGTRIFRRLRVGDETAGCRS